MLKTYASLALCCSALFLIGCASTQPGTAGFERHEGHLQGSAYEIRIHWDGDRCHRREIHVTRDCGTCRTQSVSKAVIVDRDCDGRTDDTRFRLATEQRRVNRVRFDENAWLAFYHIVPYEQQGYYRVQ